MWGLVQCYRILQRGPGLCCPASVCIPHVTEATGMLPCSSRSARLSASHPFPSPQTCIPLTEVFSLSRTVGFQARGHGGFPSPGSKHSTHTGVCRLSSQLASHCPLEEQVWQLEIDTRTSGPCSRVSGGSYADFWRGLTLEYVSEPDPCTSSNRSFSEKKVQNSYKYETGQRRTDGF